MANQEPPIHKREPWPSNIRIVCTDRGEHPSRELAVVMATPNVRDQSRWTYSPTEFRQGPRGRVACQVVDDHVGGLDAPKGVYRRRWKFSCPSCRRNPQFRDEQMTRLIEGLRSAGTTFVDLSYLPANLSGTK